MRFILHCVAATALATTVSNQEKSEIVPPLNGVYCRGSACRYKNSALGTVGEAAFKAGQGLATVNAAEEAAKAALALGDDAFLSQKEFCRGSTCVNGMGHPVDRTQATFVAQCSHLFEESGLQGTAAYRTIEHVHESFGNVCGPRVGYAEWPFCRAYGDVITAALSPELEESSVGGLPQICGNLFTFLMQIKQAQVDLQLFEGSATPPDLHTAGPDTQRGRKWAKYVEMSTAKPLDETHDKNDITSLAAEKAGEAHSQMSEVDNDKKYEVTMGSWDGSLKALKAPKLQFDYCEAELTEIMRSQEQSASAVVQSVVDWCNYQMMGGARPDWSDRSCLAIGKLMGLALRNIPDPSPPSQPPTVVYGALPKPAFGQASPTMPPTYTMMPTIPDPPAFGSIPKSGPVAPTMSTAQLQRMLHPVKRFLLNPGQVCQQMFVAISAASRVEGIMRDSYRTSFRNPPPGLTMPSTTDPLLMALQGAADFRKAAALTKQAKELENAQALKDATKSTSDLDSVVAPAAASAAAPAAAMPDSDAFNPVVVKNGTAGLAIRRKVLRG